VQQKNEQTRVKLVESNAGSLKKKNNETEECNTLITNCQYQERNRGIATDFKNH
jgi:hypothetical protein